MKSTTELLDQLLQDPNFKVWAIGEAPEFNQYWKDWEGNDPLRSEILYQAKHVMKAFQGEQIHVSEEDVLQKIEAALHEAAIVEASHKKSTNYSIRSFAHFFQSWAGVAAMVLFCLTIGMATYFLMDDKSYRPAVVSSTSRQNPGRLKTVSNTDTAPLHVQLSDGSSVILQQNSQIIFPEVFGSEKRIVTLSGEAFFEVRKNKNSPFFVHAGKIVTKVLGTSFKVKAYPGDASIQVAVKTGKVAIFTESEVVNSDYSSKSETVTLLPNEQIVFGKEEKIDRPEQEIRTPTKTLPIESLNFQYHSTPLINVLNDLQLAYGVKIIFDAETIKNCSVTAQLSDEPLLQKIQWLSAILDASYSFENNQIQFNTKPCAPKQQK
jgi:transmembrane sensor